MDPEDFDDLSQFLPEREGKSAKKKPESQLRRMLGDLDESENDKSEAKIMSAIMRQNSQMRPKHMIKIEEVSSEERKRIENSLQFMGLKRSVAQVKYAETYRKTLNQMRNSTGEGSRFLWNDQTWRRTIKC